MELMNKVLLLMLSTSSIVSGTFFSLLTPRPSFPVNRGYNRYRSNRTPPSQSAQSNYVQLESPILGLRFAVPRSFMNLFDYGLQPDYPSQVPFRQPPIQHPLPPLPPPPHEHDHHDHHDVPHQHHPISHQPPYRPHFPHQRPPSYQQFLNLLRALPPSSIVFDPTELSFHNGVLRPVRPFDLHPHSIDRPDFHHEPHPPIPPDHQLPHHDHHDLPHDDHLPHGHNPDHQFPIILAAAIPVPVHDESSYLRQRSPFLGSRNPSNESLKVNSSPTNSYLPPQNK